MARVHPGGLACPAGRAAGRPILSTSTMRIGPRCSTLAASAAAAASIAFTVTDLEGTHRHPALVMLILRRFAQGVPTAQLARELGYDRKLLLERV